MRWIVAILCVFAVACGSDDEPKSNNGGTQTTGGSDAGADLSTSEDASTGVDMGTADAANLADEGTAQPVDTSPLDVMDRPAKVFVPDDYDDAEAYPLIVLLHGYSANAAIQDFYFGTSLRVTERQFVLVTPNGTVDALGKNYWDAYWCCDLYGQPVDDVAYISGLIDAAKDRFNIDPKRVYLLGHSNGGFMSYRMACDVDGIAAIASLAGSGPAAEADCSGGSTASILQIHGTADGTILYDGAAEYPAAREMTRRWAERNGCDPEPTDGTPQNFVAALPGDETTTETWGNCSDGTTVQLWTIQNGIHVPITNDAFKDGILDFLLAQQHP